MSKGLEALERIIGCSTIESHTKKWQQDYQVVEQELKEHEQYKAIEEKLGIGLNILLKDVHSPVDFIRKFGVSRIWYFDEGKLQKADIHNLDYNKDNLHLLTNDGWHTVRKVSDYGKTWAFTKEELENGKETS